MRLSRNMCTRLTGTQVSPVFRDPVNKKYSFWRVTVCSASYKKFEYVSQRAVCLCVCVVCMCGGNNNKCVLSLSGCVAVFLLIFVADGI